MHTILLIFSLFLAFGCSRPDPQPELKDSIYRDLQAQLGITQKNIVDFQKLLQEQRAVAAQVKPQTGQIKYAEKRIWETTNHLDKLYQQEKYWRLRISERQMYVRKHYLKAFNERKQWEDPEETKQYLAEKRLRQASQHWDAKERLKNFQKSQAQDQNSKPDTAQ